MTFNEMMAMNNSKNVQKQHRDIEHGIQVAIVKYFRLQYPNLASVFFAIPNGGQRSKATAGKMKAEGQLAGVSDLMLLVPNSTCHGLCIEVKTQEKASRQQDSQKAFQAAVTSNGYQYSIVRSLDEFILVIKNYLAA